jgi:hypothetical protein
MMSQDSIIVQLASALLRRIMINAEDILASVDEIVMPLLELTGENDAATDYATSVLAEFVERYPF